MIMTLLSMNHDNLCNNNTYPHGDISFPFLKIEIILMFLVYNI